MAIDDVDVDSWLGTPDPSMAILSSGQPFPWVVRVVLLEGDRAGDAAGAELHLNDDRDHAEFKGTSAFASAPEEYARALARQAIFDELKAASTPEEREAAFRRMHESLWDQDPPPTPRPPI